MITANLQMNVGPVPIRLPQSWGRGMNAAMSVLRRALGKRVKNSALQELVRKTQQVQRKMLAASAAAAQDALEFAKLNTPMDTGDLAQGWYLETTPTAEGIVYRLAHPEVELLAYLHFGTKPHVIYAKHAKALSFEIGGQRVFAKYVFHPGTAGTGFLDKIEDHLIENMKRVMEAAAHE